MRRLLSSLIDIRPGEVGITLLMSMYYFLVMVTYYFLKPARDSLFLIELGPSQLPLVFILIAVIVAPLTGLYARASRRFRLSRLVNLTTILLVLCLLLLRMLLHLQQGWVFYLFYIWVSIYGILTVSQFWLMANAVFDATQAKRIFVLLGSSAIIGSFVGGEITSLMVTTFNVATPDLLYFCVGFLIVCTGLSTLIWRRVDSREVEPRRRRRQQELSGSPGFRDSFRTVKRNRHLRLIVGIIAAAMVASTLVDYQFKTISFATFSQEKELASFLGQFYGRLSLVSLLLQVFLAQRLLRWLGVGRIILFMPMGLLLGSVGLFAFPGIIAAIILRGADGSLEYSIDKTGRELLYLPVPLEIKERTKVFIDMFIDRWFRGMAGLLLLILTVGIGLTVQQLSLVVIAVVGVWIYFCIRVRSEYINSFRVALQRREINLGEIRHSIGDSSTVDALLESLDSENEREVAYALDMLESVSDARVLSYLPPLLEHDSPEIRRRVLRLLSVQKEQAVTDGIEAMLDDSNPEVRIEAIRYREMTAGDEPVVEYLYSENAPHAAAAVGCIARYGTDEQKRRVTPELVETIASRLSHDERSHAALLRSVGTFQHPEFGPYLKRMLATDSVSTVRSAIQALGDLKDLLLLPDLIELLGDRRYRADAGRALAAFGPSVIMRLGDDLVRTDLPLDIRRHIPRTLAELPTQATVNLLVASLNDVEPELTFYVVKALNKLRTRHNDLRFPQESVDAALVEQTRLYYTVANILQVKNGSASEADHLLHTALLEKQHANLERIFRLLGLRYPPMDIYSAYQGITSDERAMRANAVEFLDNLIQSGIKQYLLPILDDLPAEQLVRKGEELFGRHIDSREEALVYLIEGDDSWLKACAIFAARDVGGQKLQHLIQAAADDRHPAVREVARAVLESWSNT